MRPAIPGCPIDGDAEDVRSTENIPQGVVQRRHSDMPRRGAKLRHGPAAKGLSSWMQTLVSEDLLL